MVVVAIIQHWFEWIGIPLLTETEVSYPGFPTQFSYPVFLPRFAFVLFDSEVQASLEFTVLLPQPPWCCGNAGL